MIFGYLDPVTGSALLQVGLGALAAAGLGWQYIRKGARTLRAALRRSSSDSNAPSPAEVQELKDRP